MKRAKQIAVVLLYLSVCLSSAFGQGLSGRTGAVKDPSGALIPNAKLLITSDLTGAVRKAFTSSEGVYSVPQLRPGTSFGPVWYLQATNPSFSARIDQCRVFYC
jgi:hypothetical protein